MERAVKRIDGKTIAELEASLALPAFPKALGYLWQAYIRLRRRKAPGFASHNPIEWTDIKAFSDVSGFRLAPWEVNLLEAIDDVFLKPEPIVSEPNQDGKPVRAVSSSSDGEGVKALTGSIAEKRVVKRRRTSPQ